MDGERELVGDPAVDVLLEEGEQREVEPGPLSVQALVEIKSCFFLHVPNLSLKWVPKMLDKDEVANFNFLVQVAFCFTYLSFPTFFSSFSHFFLHVLFFLSLFSLSFLAKKFIETLNFCFSHVSSVVDGHVKSFTSPLVLSIGRFARYDIREYSITSLSFRFCFSRFKLATL